MNRLALLLIFVPIVGLTGCGESKSAPESADTLAISDPNAKGRELLTQFAEAEDPSSWVQQNTFALAVFQKVTDPQVKADYDAKIAPLLNARP